MNKILSVIFCIALVVFFASFKLKDDTSVNKMQTMAFTVRTPEQAVKMINAYGTAGWRVKDMLSQNVSVSTSSYTYEKLYGAIIVVMEK